MVHLKCITHLSESDLHLDVDFIRISMVYIVYQF